MDELPACETRDASSTKTFTEVGAKVTTVAPGTGVSAAAPREPPAQRGRNHHSGI